MEYDPQDTPALPVTRATTWLGNGRFRLTISSEHRATLEVLASGDLTNWTSAGWISNMTSTTNFANTAAALNRRFQRLRRP